MARKQLTKAQAVQIKPQACLIALFVIICGMALLCAPFAKAEESAESSPVWLSNSTVVVPDTLYYYNPLSDEQSYDRQRFSSLALVMGNHELALAADDIRNSDMSISQRILNHQWLNYHSGDMKMREGNRALGKLLQMGLRTYWNGLRTSRFKDDEELPYADNSGNFFYAINNMDYRIRVSKSKVRLMMSYDF